MITPTFILPHQGKFLTLPDAITNGKSDVSWLIFLLDKRFQTYYELV